MNKEQGRFINEQQASPSFNKKDYTLLSKDFFTNPHPYYDLLRREDPVYWFAPKDAWLVTRYEDVSASLRDQRFSVRRDKVELLPPDVREELEPLRRFYSMWLMYLDAPDHTRLRKSTNRAFVPAEIQGMEENIAQSAKQFLTPLRGKEQIDVLNDFATPLSIKVVADMIGFPEQDHMQVKEWSDDIVAYLVGRVPEKIEAGRNAQNAMHELGSYLKQFVSQPTGKVTNLLNHVYSAVTGGVLNEEELIAICSNIIVDGHEPIANAITSSTLALLQNPDQRDLFLHDPTTQHTAIEELLRYEPPFPYAGRRVKENLILGNQEIKEGQRVLLMLDAANRDPEAFSEPHRLDLKRTDVKHRAFGFGQHFCIGAPLARPTIQEGLQSLFRTFPTMTLTDKPLERHQTIGYRSLKSLPVHV